MKREFLEGLGLSCELVDSIIAEHGRSVEALKSRCNALEGRVEREAELSSALENERAAFSAFKSGVIRELVNEARPSSSMAREELTRRLNECGDGSIRQTLSDLRISEPDAFAQATSELPVFSEHSTSPSPTPTSIPFSRIR